MAQKKERVKPIEVEFDSDVLRRVRKHTRSSMNNEVCGVLIGAERGDTVVIEAAIAGENAGEGSAHVTFTQETWEHIYKIKDVEYPDARIVGWYHSHPGFGVFLSDHDTFIHENFFSSPKQIAWVHDPHSDEEGCFGWLDGKIRRLPRILITDSGKDKVSGGAEQKPVAAAPDPVASPAVAVVKPRKGRRWVTLSLTHLAILALGLLAGSILLPRFLVVDQQGRPVDPRALIEFLEQVQRRERADHPATTRPPEPDRPRRVPR
jgi:proteasome lid subunit RPN8/RPN11